MKPLIRSTNSRVTRSSDSYFISIAYTKPPSFIMRPEKMLSTQITFGQGRSGRQRRQSCWRIGPKVPAAQTATDLRGQVSLFYGHKLPFMLLPLLLPPISITMRRLRVPWYDFVFVFSYLFFFFCWHKTHCMFACRLSLASLSFSTLRRRRKFSNQFTQFTACLSIDSGVYWVWSWSCRSNLNEFQD